MEPSPEVLRRSIADQEHLRLLTIGFWVAAGLDAFGALMGLAYAVFGGVMGTFIAHVPAKPGAAPPPQFLGWIFAAFGGVFFTVFFAMAVLKFLAGRYISQRKHRFFCQVAAVITCLGIPWGTVVGVCALIVLSRPTVIPLFDPAGGTGAEVPQAP